MVYKMVKIIKKNNNDKIINRFLWPPVIVAPMGVEIILAIESRTASWLKLVVTTNEYDSITVDFRCYL